jgi:hypothetical protein
MIEIPFEPDPLFVETIILDNIPYKFRFMWSTQNQWTMSILDRNGSVLIAGVRLVLDIDLLEDHPDLGLPKGKLYVVDYSDNESELGRYDFVNNRQCKIIYFEEGEVI